MTLVNAQYAALSAFDTQGPRFARFLEALSLATPDEVVVSGITAQADGMNWRATVSGIALTEGAASGQAAVNALIRSLSDSPYVGPAVQPPSLRVVSGTAGAPDSPAGDQRIRIAEGMSGVEFALQFELPK